MASPMCSTSMEAIHLGEYNILFRFSVCCNIVIGTLVSCLDGTYFKYWPGNWLFCQKKKKKLWFSLLSSCVC
jgi:hypothetical protein